jgi:biopolymer transport protein ExbD
MAKGRRSLPEVNAGSMADIAFLLLIFFLVTTTMDTDKGISIVLPPLVETPADIVPVKDKNVLKVLINSKDQLLVEDEWRSVTELTQIALDFITNNNVDPRYSESPQKAVISLKNDRSTSYGIYVQVQNELKRAYNELRNKEAQKQFGKDYEDLNKIQRKKVKEVYPMKISEAEPANIENS